MLTGKLFYVEVESHREYEDKKEQDAQGCPVVGFAGYENG